MKPIFKLLLKLYLKYLAKLVLFIHRPTIIAVAGSTNKTFTKNQIRKRLEEKGVNVWAGSKSFNTEIGLPLSVLRIPFSGYNSYKNWLAVLPQTLTAAFQKNYPEVLVVELGISKAGDMKHLLSIVKPKIAVITDITQRYLESFSGMDHLVAEYRYLVKKVPQEGIVILNSDNLRVKNLQKLAKCVVENFGLSDCNWKIEKIEKREKGLELVIRNKEEISNHQLNSFGQHNACAYLIGLIIEKKHLFQKNKSKVAE